jgi:chromosome segregation ATPase
MSKLGFVSGHLEREQQLLRELNSALLALEAEALGKTAALGFSEEDVSSSRQILHNFVSRLEAALGESKAIPTDIQVLVYRIKNHKKPLEDWQQDLKELANRLQTSEQLRDADMPILEDILSLLDSEFVEGIQRLFFR